MPQPVDPGLAGNVSATTPDTPKPRWQLGGRNLPIAIGVGAVLVAFVICSLLWFHWGFVVLVAGVITVGVWEVGKALEKTGSKPPIMPVLVGTPLLLVGSYAAGVDPHFSGIISALTVQVAGLGLMTVITVGRRLRGGIEGFVRDVSAGVFIIGYLPLLGGSIMLMLADDHAEQRLCTYLLCVVANDTGAFFVGSWLGKHKMAPQVSPSKTWEGLVGGVALSVIVGIPLAIFVLQSPWWVGLILGVTLAITGTIGDAVESAIKRDAGLKDMGKLFPGHGGAMDRLDSLLFAAPVAWLVMYLFV
jgi:phosphatidate cytidylyltransferase